MSETLAVGSGRVASIWVPDPSIEWDSDVDTVADLYKHCS